MNYLMVIVGMAIGNFFSQWITKNKDYRKAQEISVFQAVAVCAVWIVKDVIPVLLH